MPNFLDTFDNSGAVASVAFADLNGFERGCIEAMFFTASDECEGASFDELSPDALGKVQHMVGLFLEQFPDTDWNGAEPEQVGRDIWFTVNGHGVGFWDRPELYGDELAELATDRARKMTGRDMYRGDDGAIYLM